MTSKFSTLLNSSLVAVGVTASSVLLGWQASALAASVTFSGTGTNTALPPDGSVGNPLSAEVTFDDMINPNKLTVTLTNLNGASIPSDILTGLFWNITGDPTLSLDSATAPSVITNNVVTGTNVNLLDVNPGPGVQKEWGFAFNSSGLGGDQNPQVTQHYGLGTAGFGISPGFGVGGGQQFPYGIVSSVNSNANNPVENASLVNDSAVFVLSRPINFDLNSIQNVRFQYGTALNAPSFPGEEIPPEEPEVPEPRTMAGLVFFLGGLMLTHKRKSFL